MASGRPMLPSTAYEPAGQVVATRLKSVRRPHHYGRVAPWERVASLRRGPLGPPRARPQMGA
eukprot:13424781-Alexandrium_andersonii.AAC.1